MADSITYESATQQNIYKAPKYIWESKRTKTVDLLTPTLTRIRDHLPQSSSENSTGRRSTTMKFMCFIRRNQYTETGSREGYTRSEVITTSVCMPRYFTLIRRSSKYCFCRMLTSPSQSHHHLRYSVITEAGCAPSCRKAAWGRSACSPGGRGACRCPDPCRGHHSHQVPYQASRHHRLQHRCG